MPSDYVYEIGPAKGPSTAEEKILGSMNIALGNFNARLADDVGRLEQLSGRLFGPMVESAQRGGENAVPPPNGALDELSLTRESTDHLLERLMRVTNSLVQLA